MEADNNLKNENCAEALMFDNLIPLIKPAWDSDPLSKVSQTL